MCHSVIAKGLENITLGLCSQIDSVETRRCIAQQRSDSLPFFPPFLLFESPICNAPLPLNNYLVVYNHTIV